MQIKTTMRYNFTLTRMATVKEKKAENKSFKNVKRLEPLCTAGGNIKWYSPVENSIEVAQK